MSSHGHFRAVPDNYRKSRVGLGIYAVNDELHMANTHLSRKQILDHFCTGPELDTHVKRRYIFELDFQTSGKSLSKPFAGNTDHIHAKCGITRPKHQEGGGGAAGALKTLF